MRLGEANENVRLISEDSINMEIRCQYVATVRN